MRVIHKRSLVIHEDNCPTLVSLSSVRPLGEEEEKDLSSFTRYCPRCIKMIPLNVRGTATHRS
jgi:hypothetical protein